MLPDQKIRKKAKRRARKRVKPQVKKERLRADLVLKKKGKTRRAKAKERALTLILPFKK